MPKNIIKLKIKITIFEQIIQTAMASNYYVKNNDRQL